MSASRLAGVCLGVLVAGASIAAQEPAVRLTLDEAQARGLAYSHRLAELGARAAAAEASEAGQHAAALPVVAAVAGYTRTNHVDEFSLFQLGQGVRVLYPDAPNNYRARIDLQWPIYTAGRIDALQRAARAERQAAAADLAAARADLRLEIARAFWAVVTAQDAAAVLERALDRIDAHVRDLRSRLEQGLIPPNDVLSAEAQRSRERLLAIEASNTRASAEADLLRLTGDRAARVDPVVPAGTPGPPAAAVAALIDQALARRPDRLASAERVAEASAREAAVVAAARPQLAVDAGYDYARPNPRFFPRTDSWRDSFDVSINGTWTLWDGGRSRAERAEAAANVRAAHARVDDLDTRIALDVRQRSLELGSSLAAIAAAEDGVRSATEARRVVIERFDAGVATSTDVLDAEVALLQAGLDRTRAIAAARLAEARLARAAGTP